MTQLDNKPLDNGNKLRRVIQKFLNTSAINNLPPTTTATTTVFTHFVASSVDTQTTWGSNYTTVLFNVTTPSPEFFSNLTTMVTPTSPYFLDKEPRFTTTQVIIIATFAAFLSIVTVLGNILVMVSFKIDKTLQTISNYFLFSLAVADFAIGAISMPLFTVYTILGYWPLGPMVCDTWLALDYLASNASVLNLLIISFDRYFSVTRPLTYRAKRTTKRAACMIVTAWGVSMILWPPWIFAWPYIEGERRVPYYECYIQFIETNHYITFLTAIAAFYIPVSVMIFLYLRIYKETEKRKKDDEQTAVTLDPDSWRKGDDDSELGGPDNRKPKPRPFSRKFIQEWCIAWWHSGREEDPDCDLDDTPSDIGGYATPVSVETPVTSCVSRCTSLNVIKDSTKQQTPPTRIHHVHYDSKTLPSTSANLPKIGNNRSVSSDSVYTILIRLPLETDGSGDQPSIKMIPDENLPRLGKHPDFPAQNAAALNRRPSHISDIRIPLNAKMMNKNAKLLGKQVALGKKKKKSQEKKAERKAAKTLSAILLTFIITWLPYSILVLLKPITTCSECIPNGLWDFFYYLCYINSTINPVCYALCNDAFRATYIRILTCKWNKNNRALMNRAMHFN
ncbi:hypothetical protein M8J75_005152 [Diaphorina citri]|nr:hypothetical protein M8J75_005152 [Diaphorina citri]